MKILFASKSCGRCGGTGTYHVALDHGASARSCYGCGGTGRLLLPSGKKSRAEFQAKRAELVEIPAVDVRVGDRILIDGRWRDVLNVGPVTGGRMDFDLGKFGLYGALLPQRFETAARLHAAWPALVTFARSLPGTTVEGL